MPTQLPSVPTDWSRYLAEFFGTFVLVFVGTAAIASANLFDTPVLLVAAFAFGLGLLAGLYAFAEVSGGHFNPAVSLAMFLDRRLDVADMIKYWVAQLLGGIVAAFVLYILTNQSTVASTATTPGTWGVGSAFLMEFVATTIFVTVILQASVSGRFGPSALIAIPLTLATLHLAAIPFSGSSLNPARTFGPALVGQEWSNAWIYFIAPPLGAFVAWVVHAIVVKGRIAPTPAPVAEVLDEPDTQPIDDAETATLRRR